MTAPTIRLASLLLCGLIAACAAPLSDRASALADEIRRMDPGLVESVAFDAPDMVDIGSITINLRDGATRRDALDVLCDFVQPRFVAAQLDGEIAVAAMTPDGTMLANGGADCEGWPD